MGVLQEKDTATTTKDEQQLMASQSALVPYIPKSKATFKMQTLVPRNLAFETQVALNRITQEFGDIDGFVRDQLRYTSLTHLWNAFSAEQVDAIGLYIKQFRLGKSLIIADATGIGKGREAAGILRHAVMEGYLPVFFTQKVKLFTDIYRDLKAIDFTDIHPFILNTDTQAKVKDADGAIVFSAQSSKYQKELLASAETIPTDSDRAIAYFKSIGKDLPDIDEHPTVTINTVIEELPADYDMIFSTYSQLQSAAPYKYLWLKKLSQQIQAGLSKYKGVVFILDECHTIGSHQTIIGQAILTLLALSKSCCFLSATFAKYPEVMPIYAGHTAISEAGLSNDRFVSAIERGGLALQEIISPNLAEVGQLISRQRSNKGVNTYYEVLDEEPQRSLHREQVDRIIKIMRSISKFESTHLNHRFALIHTKAKALGDTIKQRPKNLGVKQSPYFSRVFGIVDQMLFALKAKAVAQKAVALLEQDKKVVIAFKSTMGAFLDDLNLSSGDTIALEDLDFVHILQKGLDSIFYYNYISIDGEKSRERIPLSELSPEARSDYQSLKARIEKERSGLLLSPIDVLIDHITKSKKAKTLGGHTGKHFKVAEVTGRKQRLRFEDDRAIVQSFRSDSEKAFRLFNSGQYDVLLINQSGSTGASAHASKDFEDQRQRAMLIHQFELDINTVVQILGRINRTGQVVLPEYHYITSDIPMEKRMLTMLKAKLKTLDANTTGSQKTRDDALKSPDFLNKYGDTVALSWIRENKALMPDLGYPNHSRIRSESGSSSYILNTDKTGAIRQLTGRAGLLFVKDQERLFKELLERYAHQIQLEKQQGTYDLEIEFLQLDAEIKKRFLYKKGIGGQSAFGNDTVREQSTVNNLNRPFTRQQVESRLTKALQGQPPTYVQQQLLAAINTRYPEIIAKRKAVMDKKTKQLLTKLETLQSKTERSDLQQTAFEALPKLIREQQRTTKEDIDYLKKIEARIKKHIGLWQIGDAVRIPRESYTLSEETRDAPWGVFLGVSIGKSANNPFTLSNVRFNFAVTDARKSLSLTLSQNLGLVNAIFKESTATPITDQERQEVLLHWNDRIKHASSKREMRQVLTGNILAAANLINGKNRLIKYNTTTGTIQSGILISRSAKAQAYKGSTFPISQAQQHIITLKLGDYFASEGEYARFQKLSPSTIQVFLHKKELYKASINPELQGLLIKQVGAAPNELPDFVQNANEMTGVLPLKHLSQFLKLLNMYGVYYIDEATEIKALKAENEADWKARTTRSKKRYVYELGKPYGKTSHPTAGFENYFEGDGTYPRGRVVYSRPLTDKERYNFTLIPLFQDANASYKLWKASSEKTALWTSFEKLIDSVKNQPLYEAVQALGFFIFNHPHEQGNPEFVFGQYTPGNLGKAAYSDQIGTITPLVELVAKLTLQQQLLKIAS